MYINPDLRTIRVFLVLLIFIGLFSIGCMIFLLLIDEWIEYCYFKFGLFASKSTYFIFAGYPDNISDLYDDLCNDSYAEKIINYLCVDFCEYLSNIRKGGIIIFVSTLISSSFQSICIVIYFTKLIKIDIRVWPSKLFSLFSAFSFSIGLLIYLLTTKPYDMKDPEGIEAENASMRSGIHFALFIAILLFVQYFVSLLFIAKIEKKEIGYYNFQEELDSMNDH